MADEMDPNMAFNTMELGSAGPKVDKIQTQIDRIKARQERFGEEVSQVASSKINQLNKRITSLKAFEKPVEIKEGATILPDTVYLYGTDYMSNSDINQYIGTQFPEHTIKWINDSSCTIKLSTAETAEQMFQQFSVRRAALITKQAESTEQES